MTSTLPPLVQACSGALGSASANALSYPLDLVSARIQNALSKRYQGIEGLRRALRSVINTRGFAGLYDGLPSDTGATILSNFLYFYAYSYIRSFVIRHKSPSSQALSANSAAKKLTILLSIPEELAIGLFAGIASRAVSTPLSLITVQLQTQSPTASNSKPMSEDKSLSHAPDDSDSDSDESDSSPKTVLSVMRSIYRHEGLLGFWRGFGITATLCLNPALTLLFYQAFRRAFIRDPKQRASPSPRQAFLGGSFSNAIAVALLYPLILAKTRLQASRSSRSADAKSLPAPAHSTSKYQPPTDLIRGVWRIWQDAYTAQGLRGVYRGLEVQILKGFVNQGVTMMVKQRIEAAVVKAYLKRIGANGTVQ